MFPEPYSTVVMLREADGKPCPYCHNVMKRGTRRPPTRDHIRPRRAGGTLAQGNCIIVCSPCNGDKGDMMLVEFLESLRRKGDPRADIIRDIINYGVDPYVILPHVEQARHTSVPTRLRLVGEPRNWIPRPPPIAKTMMVLRGGYWIEK